MAIDPVAIYRVDQISGVHNGVVEMDPERGTPLPAEAEKGKLEADGATVDKNDIGIPFEEVALLTREIEALEDIIGENGDDSCCGSACLEQVKGLEREIAYLTEALVESDWAPATHADMEILERFRSNSRDLPIRGCLSAHKDTREEQIRTLKFHYGVDI